MSRDRSRTTEHDITIDAPALEVYRLLADVEDWPTLFPPNIHVECLERTAGSERIQMWALANGSPKTWTSRRELDVDGMRIDFRQERSAAPVATMGGSWIVEPLSADRCHVRLLHDYTATDPSSLHWIDNAVERNSSSELTALRAAAEAMVTRPELTFSFTDEITFDGPARVAFDFVNEADRWEERLPHVARVEMNEEVPGLQVLEMDTRTRDGSVHTTRSVRVVLGEERIAYKQIQVPALMTVHTGMWTFTEPSPGVTTASSQHTVVINEANVRAVLGEDADVARARTFVHEALSANSLATLGRARDHVAARV